MMTQGTQRGPRRGASGRRTAKIAGVLAAGGVLAAAGGCYERVVGTDDPNYQGEIWRSNLDESRVPVLDDALDELEGKEPRRR